MSKNQLVAPCGLYCGICPVYQASSDRSLAKKLADGLKLPVEVVHCRGCLGEQGKIMGDAVCETYQCITQRGHSFCYECSDFPCLKLAPTAYKADFLPHNQKIYNLLLIKKMGVEKWVKEATAIRRRYFQGKKARGGSDLKLE